MNGPAQEQQQRLEDIGTDYATTSVFPMGVDMIQDPIIRDQIRREIRTMYDRPPQTHWTPGAEEYGLF